MRLLSACAATLLFLACLPSARAQGLVQLTLSGEVDRTGGARAVVEVTIANHASGYEARTHAISVFLAERTTAADLAVLLDKRLGAAGLRVLHTGDGQAARAVSCLFIDDVIAIALRLGQGLRGSVTLAEDRPAAVRILPPEDAKSDGHLRITASTYQPHLRTHSRTELELRINAEMTPNRIADLLATQGIQHKWPGEIERHEIWRPGDEAAGSEVQGCSFDLQSSGDWRIEVTLNPRRRDR